MLHGKISALKGELIKYANFTEKMIEKSIAGLLEKDAALLSGIIEKDEHVANSTEIKLDGLCTTLIAQYEPRAKELRTILMILKMNNDLERIADHAVNIAESGLFLIDKPQVKPLIDIPRMADIVMGMIKDSIDSFIGEKPELARGVCRRDSQVDDLRDQILRELITYMSSDPSTIERAIHLLRISSNLERLGDLSTNICEEVVYAVEGTVIKHHLQDDERRGTA
jgi:phosphate transport system protein